MASRALVLAMSIAALAGCTPPRRFPTQASTSSLPMRGYVVPPPGDESFRASPPELTPVGSRASADEALVEARLSNGVRVVMLPRRAFPASTALLVLDRGSSAAAPGVAALYGNVMTGSSASYERFEAWEYLRYVGARVSAHAQREVTVLEVSALAPLFASALSRAVPMFASPSLTSAELDEGRRWLAAERALRGSEASAVAADVLDESLYGASHPSGVPLLGTEEGAVTTDAVRAFRDGNLGADRVTVVCVGDFEVGAVTRTLERLLGGLPRRARAPGDAPAPTPASTRGNRVVVIDRPGAAQAEVLFGWRGPRASDDEAAALEVLAGAAAGGLSSRFNLTVRKELGASYGVRMGVRHHRADALTSVSAAIDTARVVTAIEGMMGELARLRREPLDESALAVARLRAGAEHGGAAAGVAREIAEAILLGRRAEVPRAARARVFRVSAEQVRAAAERWLAPEEQRLVVVGDAARLLPGLRALNLGEIAVVRAR